MTPTDGMKSAGSHSAGAPAGWYPDPLNPSEIRWWDGRGWGPTATEARQDRASRARRFWVLFWVLLVVLLALMVLWADLFLSWESG